MHYSVSGQKLEIIFAYFAEPVARTE